MVTVKQLTTNLKQYIFTQIETMAKTNPIVSFMKPIVTRIIEKNFDKTYTMLELIADKDGNIDIENILTEMMESVMTTDPFIFKTPVLGDIELGGGLVKFNLPFTTKKLVFNQSDLKTFKEMLTVNG